MAVGSALKLQTVEVSRMMKKQKCREWDRMMSCNCLNA